MFQILKVIKRLKKLPFLLINFIDEVLSILLSPDNKFISYKIENEIYLIELSSCRQLHHASKRYFVKNIKGLESQVGTFTNSCRYFIFQEELFREDGYRDSKIKFNFWNLNREKLDLSREFLVPTYSGPSDSNFSS